MTNQTLNKNFLTDKLNTWFDDLVSQAIIGAIEIRRRKICGLPEKPNRKNDDQNIMLVTGGIMYLGIIFVLLARWAEGV